MQGHIQNTKLEGFDALRAGVVHLLFGKQLRDGGHRDNRSSKERE